MNPTSEILKRITKNSSDHPNGVYTRLYRYLLRQDIYIEAYKNLYRNNGAATKGINADTADGFSVEYIHEIIESLKNQTYKPNPVKRIQIPKKNGKRRPLGLPTFKDKLVQDAIRQILEAIYEPNFSNFSHGFRAKRSCHKALKQMSRYFNGIKWFIEGDLKEFFDSIDHSILLKLLSEKIKDSKLIGLIAKFLKAGYIENWRYHKTYSGTPQGGILSPILANIYLNELDKKIEEIKQKFDKPAKRLNGTFVYGKKLREILFQKKLYGTLTDPKEKKSVLKKIRQLKVQLRKLPRKDTTDKKIAYVRYADDFIIGVCGSRSDCEKLKELIKIYLRDKLKLELSDEKTKITHSAQKARFLGYDISVRRNNVCKRQKNGIVRRTLNNTVELAIPFENIEKFLYENKIVEQKLDSSMFPCHRNKMIYLTDLEIVDIYNAEIRGIGNYYSLAANFAKLNYFAYLMEYSCLKTLARKHRSSIAKIKKMYRFGHSWGIPYMTKKEETKKMMIVRFPDLQNGKVKIQKCDVISHNRHYANRNSFDERLKANKCELCGKSGSTTTFEIHHVNKIKNLKGKSKWERVMIARKRKTLVVCRECHLKIHHSS